MNRTLLLSLYPQKWRQRYQDEFLDVLEQMPLTLPILWDTLRGALDAHLHPSLIPIRKQDVFTARHGRHALRYWLLVAGVAIALTHPWIAARMAAPRRNLGTAFLA